MCLWSWAFLYMFYESMRVSYCVFRSCVFCFSVRSLHCFLVVIFSWFAVRGFLAVSYLSPVSLRFPRRSYLVGGRCSPECFLSRFVFEPGGRLSDGRLCLQFRWGAFRRRAGCGLCRFHSFLPVWVP